MCFLKSSNLRIYRSFPAFLLNFSINMAYNKYNFHLHELIHGPLYKQVWLYHDNNDIVLFKTLCTISFHYVGVKIGINIQLIKIMKNCKYLIEFT